MVSMVSIVCTVCMAWHGLAFGLVFVFFWYGMVRYGMVRYATVWYSTCGTYGTCGMYGIDCYSMYGISYIYIYTLCMILHIMYGMSGMHGIYGRKVRRYV